MHHSLRTRLILGVLPAAALALIAARASPVPALRPAGGAVFWFGRVGGELGNPPGDGPVR